MMVGGMRGPAAAGVTREVVTGATTVVLLLMTDARPPTPTTAGAAADAVIPSAALPTSPLAGPAPTRRRGPAAVAGSVIMEAVVPWHARALAPPPPTHPRTRTAGQRERVADETADLVLALVATLSSLTLESERGFTRVAT